jgi:lipid-binding SYLF domain-containing protein
MTRWNPLLALAATTSVAWLSLSSTPSATSPTTLEDDLLRNATHVFQRAVDERAAAIPASVLLRAHGIAVFPKAVVNGPRYEGQGVVSARGPNPSYWSPPAVIAFEGSIPLELESRAVDFVFVAQTARGLHYLVQERFVSPVVLPIIPGPLGRDTRALTSADLVAYMQFGEYFAGVTISDWTIGEVAQGNARLYGRPYSTDEIVRGAGFFHLPPAAREWRAAIAAHFREMS